MIRFAALILIFSAVIPAIQSIYGWQGGLAKPAPHVDGEGKAHLLFALNDNELRRNWLKKLAQKVRFKLRRSRIRGFYVAFAGTGLRVKLRKPADADLAHKALLDLIRSTGNTAANDNPPDLEIMKDGDSRVTVTPTKAQKKKLLTWAMKVAVEVMRKRVDAMGLTTPNIVRQGKNRILVQVPGVVQTTKLKEVLGRKGEFSLRLVHPFMLAAEVKAGRMPWGYKIIPSASGPVLVHNRVIVSGQDLVSLQPGFSKQSGEPVLFFDFNRRGALAMERVTKNNIGRLMALVVDNGFVTKKDDVGHKIKVQDNRVLSTLLILEVVKGSSQFNGISPEQSRRLALQIGSGALPASVTLWEERILTPKQAAD